MANNEIWKDIKGYEGIYQISSFGRVISLNFNQKKSKGFLKVILNRRYPYVDLSKNNIVKHKSIHRLVAEAFLENKEEKPTVNHKDGNRLNNNLDNLEWATYSENNKHAHLTGLNRISEKCRKINSERNKLSGKKVFQYDFNYVLIKEHISQSLAAKELGLFASNISACVLGKSKFCGGFYWSSKRIENGE